MKMTRFNRYLTAWIACLALLFAALAPSVTVAMSAANGAGWAEICTVSGPKQVKVMDGEMVKSGAPMQKSMHLEHCPFCLTHGSTFALPSGTGLTLALFDIAEVRPFLFFRSPRPLAIWVAAQPRAPPASS
jgi:Protein of unknown function (DUF2946)